MSSPASVLENEADRPSISRLHHCRIAILGNRSFAVPRNALLHYLFTENLEARSGLQFLQQTKLLQGAPGLMLLAANPGPCLRRGTVRNFAHEAPRCKVNDPAFARLTLRRLFLRKDWRFHHAPMGWKGRPIPRFFSPRQTEISPSTKPRREPLRSDINRTKRSDYRGLLMKRSSVR